MRYGKTDALLRLAIELQGARAGLSLGDIAERFEIGRRTAMRMRDAVQRIFPHLEEVETDDRTKRWRLPAGTLNGLVSFEADELADLDMAIGLLHRDNRKEQAGNLAGLAAKLKAMMKPEAARKVEPDLDALLEAEGLAMRPGPRPRIKPGLVEELRLAIKGCNRVRLTYRRRGGDDIRDHVIEPYGFLHGHRHYLIAWHEHEVESMYLMFSLPNVEAVEILPQTFARDPDFSLADFAARSFGLFQEEPFDVVWRFSPEAADTAREFIFHPSQAFEDQPDGSLIVRFTAGSDMEMAWHLYCWGEEVEVLEPARLAEMVHGQRREWDGLP